MHVGAANIMMAMDDRHFKRMGTPIAMLGVKKDGGDCPPLDARPAVHPKVKKSCHLGHMALNKWGTSHCKGGTGGLRDIISAI